MNKVHSLIFVFLVVISGFVYWNLAKKPLEKGRPVACTMDAKVCPDGTAVGRITPECDFAECPSVGHVTDNSGDLSLGVGQEGKIGNLEVTLVSVPEDSRCPIDVVCIQAGKVDITVNANDGTRSEKKSFSTNDGSALFLGYLISIVSVEPAPYSKKVILENQYRVKLHVEPENDSTNASGTVKGMVTLSPVCPVERIPPDPNCAPKPYQAKIQVFTSDGTELVKTLQSKTDGTFSVSLPPGDYNIEALSGSVYPRCSSETVSVKAGGTISTAISCDTGIR